MKHLITVTLTFPADYEGFRKLTSVNSWLLHNRLPLLGLLEVPPEPGYLRHMVPMAKAQVFFTEELEDRARNALLGVASSMDWPHASLHWKDDRAYSRALHFD